MRHSEGHMGHRVGWLRAMVLGANDGIISTAALLLGVAAADASRSAILTAGMAGLVAGAVSMALGEYVSVSSQRDSERSDIAKETWELEHMADHELEELTAIYESKGLSSDLAAQVALELTAHDALAAHLREELGITADDLANPIQAAWSSAPHRRSGRQHVDAYRRDHHRHPAVAGGARLHRRSAGWGQADEVHRSRGHRWRRRNGHHHARRQTVRRRRFVTKVPWYTCTGNE
jgi:VIT family